MEVVVITIDLLIAQTTTLAVVDHLIIVVIGIIVVVAVVVAIVVVEETTIDLLLQHRPHLLPLHRSVQRHLCYPIHVDHPHGNPPPNANIANITTKSHLPPGAIIVHHRENVVKNINIIVAVPIMMMIESQLHHHVLLLLYLLTVNANTIISAVVTADFLPLDVPHPHVKIIATVIIITNHHPIIITVILPIKMIMMAKMKKIQNEKEILCKHAV